MSDDIGPLVDLIVNAEDGDTSIEKEALQDQLDDLEYDQWALLLEALPTEDRLAQWQQVPVEMQAEVLVDMRSDACLSIINALSSDMLDQLFGQLSPEDLIELSDSLPEHLIGLALQQMDHKQRKFFEHSNQFNDNQIGRYADHNLLILPQNAKVYDALRLFRRDIPECTDALFLTDRAGRYAGTVPLQSTFGAPGHIPLVELLDEVLDTSL